MNKKQELPKWFKGEVYQRGDIVENRFGGGSIKLNAKELSEKITQKLIWYY